VLELLADQENKDAVEELVTQFIEKIEAEASLKDGLITKGWKNEWAHIQAEILESQHMRGRNIINEIIATTAKFSSNISKFGPPSAPNALCISREQVQDF